ncbi:MAG TPA: hypothetical protein VJ302_00605 [Blastocatellia bacterium]|nr:hypothetical protein [Blastocatellia bacterium]
MPLQLPNLDDRRYADLIEEARHLIPNFEPRWTNHNPSDPGITLIELFAYLTELLIYRLDRVTSRNVLSFLKLLNGTEWDPFSEEDRAQPPESAERDQIAQRLESLSPEELLQLITVQLPKTVSKLRRLERAVSSTDFEALAFEADPRVVRARCIPRRNLELDLKLERPGHVSLIVVAASDGGQVVKAVKQYLDPKPGLGKSRLLLTTRLHVVEPFFAEVGIEAKVMSLPDRKKESLEPEIVRAVTDFLNPLPDRARGSQGWPFGRNVYVSELFAMLDRLDGVDYVTSITLTPPERAIKNEAGEVIAIEVGPYELVRAEITVEVTVPAS